MMAASLSPIGDDTPITVSIGVQSQRMAWSKIAKCFAHSPYMADRIKGELESDGTSRHEDIGFFHPEDRRA